MNRKNLELLQLLAIPAMVLACGGTALALVTLVQALSGEPAGVYGFAWPTALFSVVGAVCTIARLLAQSSQLGHPDQ